MRKYVIYSRTNRPKISNPEIQENYTEVIVHQEKRSTGEGVDDFEIIDVEEVKETNIKKFINSFKDDVGVEAVLRRATQTGDLSLLNQRDAIYADTTIIPEDPEERFDKAQSAQKAFESIDPDLTNGQTMEEFIKNLTPEKLEEYINKKVAEKKEKEGKE